MSSAPDVNYNFSLLGVLLCSNNFSLEMKINL